MGRDSFHRVACGGTVTGESVRGNVTKGEESERPTNTEVRGFPIKTITNRTHTVCIKYQIEHKQSCLYCHMSGDNNFNHTPASSEHRQTQNLYPPPVNVDTWLTYMQTPAYLIVGQVYLILLNTHPPGHLLASPSLTTGQVSCRNTSSSRSGAFAS